MTNPFEAEDGSYLVLANEEGQHSLWPDFLGVPAGWSQVFGPSGRQECLEYVNTHWTDMRPASLVRAMQGAGRGESQPDGVAPPELSNR